MGRAKAEQTLVQIDKLPGGETVETEIMSCLSLPMLDGIDERVKFELCTALQCLQCSRVLGTLTNENQPNSLKMNVDRQQLNLDQ